MAEPTGVETAASYGISEALLNDPLYGEEIKSVYELFKAGNEGAALEALFKTKYYTTMNATVRARKKEQLEQPEVYKDSVDKYRLAAQKRLVNTGIKIDTESFNKIISDGYAQGMSDAQLDQAIAASGKITGFGGNILGDTTTLKTYAASYGVNSLLNDAYWNSKQNALFQGSITTKDIQKEIRDLSASAFPAYADGIANGLSIASQASNIITSYATFLEVDQETVDFNNPTVRKIAQYVDPVTGKPARMPQWMVEKTIKSDPAWGFTKNGQKAVDDLTLKVSNDWFGGAR
jgi:hypothetical protein